MVEPIQPTEQPAYILPPVKKRLLIPKVIAFISLGFLFYLGVLLNLSLLSLAINTEGWVKLISLIILLIIIIVGIFLNILKSKKKYLFYNNRVALGKKQLFLKEVNNLEVKRNFLDKIFKTYSLKLTPKFSIDNIPKNTQLQSYVQKLINYSKQL